MAENEQVEETQAPEAQETAPAPAAQVPPPPVPPTPTPPPSGPSMKEIKLDDMEVACIDAAFDAKRAKMAPIEAEFAKFKKAADDRYNETVLRVVSKHGLKKVPEVWNLDLRDPQGGLIVPGVFKYVPDPETGAAAPPPPPPEKKVKPWEKLKGQKHGKK